MPMDAYSILINEILDNEELKEDNEKLRQYKAIPYSKLQKIFSKVLNECINDGIDGSGEIIVRSFINKVNEYIGKIHD